MWRIAAALLLATSPAVAMEWLGADELDESCTAFLAGSTDSDAALCLAYVQGFLAGADAAPEGIDVPSASQTEDESFSERATRTRLGTLRLLKLRSDMPDYCLDDTLSALHVVEAVAGYLESHADALYLDNAEAVYAALVNEFPCE